MEFWLRMGCMRLSHIHNEYPYRRYEEQNEGFMTGLKSYSVQTIYVTAENVLNMFQWHSGVFRLPGDDACNWLGTTM